MLRRNKRFEYEYEDEDDNNDENAIGGSFVPPAKLDWLDWLVALVLGIVATLVSAALSIKGLHPSAWTDYSVAAGLRPAEAIPGGIWRLIAGALFRTSGVGGATAILSLLGKLSLGAMTAMAYLTFKEIISILVRMVHSNWLWSRIFSRGVCALAAVLFLLADPVWSLGQAFTSATFTALVFSLSVCLLARFLSGGAIVTVYWAMFVMGVLCAETPLGFIWLFGFWMMFYVLLTKGGLFHVKLLQPLMQQSSKWYLTFFWALGLLASIALNIYSFKSHGGMQMLGLSTGQLPVKYITMLARTVTGAANFGGWVVGVGFALLPFVLAVAMLRRATDVEYFLSYHIGIVFFVTGCLAYSQLASIRPLWFWCFGKSIEVYSPVLLFLCSMMGAVTVLCALVVTLIDAFARDHRRLAAQYDPDLEEKGSGLTRKQVATRLSVFLAIALALAFGSFYGRPQLRQKEAVALINDYIAEVVTEAGDAELVFTDGMFDPAIELEAAKRGKKLKCIATDCRVWDRLGAEVRSKPLARGGYALSSLMEDKEDRLSSSAGGDTLLLSWLQLRMNDDSLKRDKLSSCAVQNADALRVWTQHLGDTYPAVSGVISPPSDREGAAIDENARMEGIARTDEFVERLLAFCTKGGWPLKAENLLADRINTILWQMAALARIRGAVCSLDGSLPRAESEYELARILDGHNAIAKGITDAIQAGKIKGLMRQKTPREGLQNALDRADFKLAHSYANYIIEADPDDPNANFAIGMDYITTGEFPMAEKYLKRCLKKKGYEPAVWNNLAVVQHSMGSYEEAMTSAKKALELAPRSLEVKDTIRRIEDAIKAKAEGREQPRTGIRVKRPAGTLPIPDPAEEKENAKAAAREAAKAE
ncbi:MAG: hypothetical protein K6F50_02545 [Kiritimatiellae bacterium]|nr:hypothetical protein [Kiritimatiellia bacterium]